MEKRWSPMYFPFNFVDIIISSFCLVEILMSDSRTTSSFGMIGASYERI